MLGGDRDAHATGDVADSAVPLGKVHKAGAVCAAVHVHIGPVHDSEGAACQSRDVLLEPEELSPSWFTLTAQYAHMQTSISHKPDSQRMGCAHGQAGLEVSGRAYHVQHAVITAHKHGRWDSKDHKVARGRVETGHDQRV